MTRAILCIGIILLTLSAGSLQGQSEQLLRFRTDSLDKQTISRSLLTVRDSLNTYRARLTQKTEDNKYKADQQIRKRLTTALLELNRSKDKLEKVIAEVADSKKDTWNTTLHDKAYSTLRDTRRDIKKIREDVKDLVLTSS
jgi:division protein CdvB (Snf7/Vps24/ESCRT-III family)